MIFDYNLSRVNNWPSFKSYVWGAVHSRLDRLNTSRSETFYFVSVKRNSMPRPQFNAHETPKRGAF